MAINRQKISQMTPKGANLEATDLMEVSVQTGSGYETRSITGQEIIDGVPGGGSQDLQQVTDIGAITTNNITVGNLASNSTTVSNGGVIVLDAVNSTLVELLDDGSVGIQTGSKEAFLQTTNVVNDDVILEFPNKATGSYTIATTGDLTSGTVTSVGTAGLISGGPITTSGTVTTSMATNKLVGRATAGTGIMEEITVGTGLTLTGAGVLNNTATPTTTGYYGAWQDVTTQTAAANNVGYPMKFGTIDYENQVRIVTDGTNLTRITFDNTGIYNINFSVQIQNIDNAEHDVTIWIRKNGVDVAGSSGYVTVPKRRSTGAGLEGHTIAGWNYLLSVVGGEYYQIMWSTTSAANVTLQFYAAGSPPPSTASTLAIVTQQAGIMGGTGITALNSLTGAVQTFAPGTSGTDFAISSTGTVHTFNLPTASASNRGALSTTDWSAFNAKASYTPRVQSVTSASTVTPVSTNDLVKITAQAAALALANPTGTWDEGQPLMIRIKDNGTARAITWDTNYRAIGITLPTTTVLSKTTYVGIIYNSTDGKWDAIGVTTQA